MSPAPRRDLTAFVIALGAGAVVLFLLVGGLAEVGRSSGPYHTTIDESFGAEARLVATESNTLGLQLHTLVDQMTGYRRMQLASALDALVSDAQGVLTNAETAASPAPEGRAGQEFLAAMTDRSTAVDQLRGTVDGLLSLTPDPSNGSPFPPPAVSPTQAVTRFTAIGQLLVAADRSYRSARHDFATDPGGSRLPASVWVPQPVIWGAGAMQTVVDQLTSSPELAPFEDVHLVAVALTPPVLPPAPGVQGQPQAAPLGAGVSEVPPTCMLSITAVVRNDGTIVAARIPVEAAVQPVQGGAPFPVKREVTLAPSASVAITLPVLPVTPGTTYNLAVTLVQPAGQTRSNGQLGATIAIAPFASAKAVSRCARVPVVAP